jgi:cellulose synthase/poly-beta-1,6-N-acetylglucosamine synthase-like glycosyltransferase
MNVFVFLLMVIAGLLAVPVAVLCTEIIAAILLPQTQLAIRSGHSARPRLAVMVPAHNESRGLLLTLSDIRGQMLSSDRLLVVADNCLDDTADIARAGGAEVIERHDVSRLGKGYALDYGLRYLDFDPPEIVIAVDADCRVEPGTIDQLAFTCVTTGRPVQSANVMISPTKSHVNHRVAEFAGRVKRWLRPLGLSALGLPCQLTGTGMAFPFEVARSANLKSGSITEDLKLSLELSLAGHAPIFCPSARVISEFPSSIQGTTSQRKRWEHGHIDTIVNDAPAFIFRAIANCNWNLMVLTLDMAVPPLSLFGILVAGVFSLAAFVALCGFSTTPFVLSTVSLSGFVVAITLAWLNCGRDVLPASTILLIARYVIGKFGLYHEILSGKADAKWDRTDRKKFD